MKRQTLSRTELDALQRLGRGVYLRRKGGFGCPGLPMISLAIANRLCDAGLAQATGGRLSLSEAGHRTLNGRARA